MDQELASCPKCHAVVADQGEHKKWHDSEEVRVMKIVDSVTKVRVRTGYKPR